MNMRGTSRVKSDEDPAFSESVCAQSDKVASMSEQEPKNRSRQRTPNNRTTTAFRISDELWAILQPRLPVPERTHSWMNRFRGLLVRWEEKPENYLAFVHFVCGLIALRAAGLFG